MGKWGVINMTGEILVPCQYDDFFGFSGGVYEFFSDLRPYEAREFVIPDGRKHVPDYAFSGCKELLHMRIPPMVTAIGPFAFSECPSLVSIEFPAGLIEIGPYAFSECTSLKSIIIPEGVSKIGHQAFENCSSLEVVVIPASLVEIEECPFAGCKSLKLISVDFRNPNYRSEGNSLIDKRTGKKV